MAKYSGDITPSEAWRGLEEIPDSFLIDVRTDEELKLVGEPMLEKINKGLIKIAIRLYPNMDFNPIFMNALIQAVPSTQATLFFLCRTGVRSAEAAQLATDNGYHHCYNIIDGFEGTADSAGQRGKLNGWKAIGLPWRRK